MDEGTLKALKTFTNFGYVLGFCPYKFITFSPLPTTTITEVEDFSDESEGQRKRWWYVFQEKLHLFFNQFENIFHRSDVKICGNWTFTHPSKGRWWSLLMSICLHLSYQCFLLCRFSQSILNEEGMSSKEKIEISYLTGVLVLHNTFIFLLVRDFGVHATYLNSLRTNLDHLIEKNNALFPFAWNRGMKFGPRSIKIFFRAATVMVILVGVGRGVKVFKNPGSELFVTSLSKDPNSLPLWMKFLAALFHFHVMAFTAFMSTFLGTTLAWYSSVMVYAVELTRLSVGNDATHSRTNGTLELRDNKEPAGLDSIQNTYYRLTALQNNFKTCYGAVPLGVELISIFVIVFNMFLAITHHDLQALPKALVMAYLLKVFLSKLAEIHTVSVQVMESWKTTRYERSKITWFPKFLNGVQSLRVYVGNFFFIDKTLILTVLAVIINLTTNLILSVK